LQEVGFDWQTLLEEVEGIVESLEQFLRFHHHVENCSLDKQEVNVVHRYCFGSKIVEVFVVLKIEEVFVVVDIEWLFVEGKFEIED